MKIKIRKTDAIFSKYIRSRSGWKCERCGKQHEQGSQGLHASHYFGRARENTRFDEKNVYAICYGCHSYFHAQPLEHTEWVKNKLGEKEFKKLIMRANTYKKRDDKSDLIILRKLYG